jgi:uroporphyrinogen decarboxylase
MKLTPFVNDYHHMLDACTNRRPKRLPIYEHIINPPFMEKVTNVKFADLINGDTNDLDEFFHHYCRFFQQMTYDTVSFEVCITSILPDNGAIMGGKPGPIQTRSDFERYPWDELPARFWKLADPLFHSLIKHIPPGMKLIGGVGNGPFEISEDLVGFEYLAYLQADDPELFADVYRRIGDLMTTIWAEFIQKYGSHYAVFRIGDDLGFKTSTLTSPHNIRKFIVPQYQRVLNVIQSSKTPFLWHSCGNIFSVMDDFISLGINAKHSNEDVIAPFEEWIHRYGDRIALIGGIDVDLLCQTNPMELVDVIEKRGSLYRSLAKGYALGSGNSIPEYVPVDGYLTMIEAAQKIREKESG